MIEFTCEAIWSRFFTFGEHFDYWFSFLTSDWSIQIYFLSSWFSLGRLYVSKNLYISSRLSNFLAYNCLSYSRMNLYISVVSLITYFSSLSLFIWILFFFFFWWVRLMVVNFGPLTNEFSKVVGYKINIAEFCHISIH